MISEALTHGNAFANHPEYDTLSGRVAYQGSVTGMTRDGWKVKHHVTYIELGRATYGDPADPDAMLEDDAWEDEAQPPAHKPKPQGKTAALLMRIFDQLQHEPLTATQLAEMNGVTHQRVKELIRRYPQNFVAMSKTRLGVAWGIAGRVRAPIYSGCMPAIVDYLREHGPSSLRAIMAALGITDQTFYAVKGKNPDAIAVVGIDTAAPYRPQLWGVVGLHDKESA